MNVIDGSDRATLLGLELSAVEISRSEGPRPVAFIQSMIHLSDSSDRS